MLPALSILALAGCDLDAVDPPEQFAWEATVQSSLEEEMPIFSGTVSMLTGSGSTDVAVFLEAAIEGTTFGWGIRTGGCGGEGDLVAPEAVFEDFVIESSGEGGATRFGIVGQIREDLEYSAEIRRGAEEDAELLVCSLMDPLH